MLVWMEIIYLQIQTLVAQYLHFRTMLLNEFWSLKKHIYINFGSVRVLKSNFVFLWH